MKIGVHVPLGVRRIGINRILRNIFFTAYAAKKTVWPFKYNEILRIHLLYPKLSKNMVENCLNIENI